MEESRIARAALSYLSRGWAVIPLAPRGKRPLVRWQSYQQAPPARAEVEAWFGETPEANVGIVTGTVSGLIVVDIDPAHGGETSLAELERRHGPLPDSVEALTGGGGRHIFFRHPGGMVYNKVGLLAGVDLRGDGGLVVAPPSVHPSGQPYVWRAGHAPDERALSEPPRWLVRLAIGGGERRGHPLRYWRALVRKGVAEGERNNTIASLAGHLFWHGVDAEVVLELLLSWNRDRCRPPLSDEDVAAVVQSIERTHEREREDEQGADENETG